MLIPKEVNIMAVLPLALAFCGFVVFTNLSLTYNTVGFYQVRRPAADDASSVALLP